MGLEVDAEDQLFLLETVIESVTLRVDRYDDCEYSQEDPPWTICFRLCKTFSFEIKQEDEEKTEENICPRTKEVAVKFHSGKSCLFTANPAKFLQIIQENPICVTVCTQYPDSDTPDILGTGEIEFDDSMITELCTCLKEDSNNSETSCKGCYPLCDNKQQQIGVIQLYLRLSFYGKCILSEFKLLSGMDNILFKVQNEDERNKCFKCGKAKAKPGTGEDEGESTDGTFADEDQCWGNTYDRPTNHVPGAFKYGIGSPSYKPTVTNNYDSYRRSNDLLRFDDMCKMDFPRQNYGLTSDCRYPSISRRSLPPTNEECLLKRKSSSESVDLWKIIGEDTMKYSLSEDTKSYIAPMLDYDEKEFAFAELKVKKAPQMKAGPKRRKRPKKSSNFEAAGVKLGHKDCIKQQKNVPKRSGWLWPEKTKKTPGWKPGSVPRRIAELIDSSKIDAVGGKGDFPRRLNKKEESAEIQADLKTEQSIKPSSQIKQDAEDQPSLHFKMCGGSYMISVNPAALGDKCKDRKNQHGLFMRLNKREEDVHSQTSDLEIAFTTPRLPCEPFTPVETKETRTQYFSEDASQLSATPLSTPRGKAWTDKGTDDEWENGVSSAVIGEIGNSPGKNRTRNQNKTVDKVSQENAKEIEANKGNAKIEKRAKTPSEGDLPKRTLWDEDQDTAVGQLRGNAIRKMRKSY